MDPLSSIDKELIIEKLTTAFDQKITFGEDNDGLYYELPFGVSIANQDAFEDECNLIATQVAGRPTILFSDNTNE